MEEKFAEMLRFLAIIAENQRKLAENQEKLAQALTNVSGNQDKMAKALEVFVESQTRPNLDEMLTALADSMNKS